MITRNKTRVYAVGLVVAAVALTAFAARRAPALQEKALVIPAPKVDETARSESAVAVFAGGCFWGVQGVFQHVTGVTNAVSGYAGGEENTASYDIVTSGRTGHAESVMVTYNPRQITYGRLLQIFFSVAHDPTQLNRQGPDVGTQYRSAIFPSDTVQTRIARAYVDQLNKARIFDDTIVTTIEAGRPFYPAESYHQDYLTLHPNEPYIRFNDLPKVDNLKRLFGDVYRATPVLVSGVKKEQPL